LEGHIRTLEEQKATLQSYSRKKSAPAQYVRDVVSILGVAFGAFGLMFLSAFSIVGIIVAAIFVGFMIQSLMELRQKNKLITGQNILITYFFIEIGMVWMHTQTLNNYFNRDARVDGTIWWINFSIAISIAAICYMNAATTRSSNQEAA
jgi:hypothetical protein